MGVSCLLGWQTAILRSPCQAIKRSFFSLLFICFISPQLFSQSRVVTGKVTDDAGAPVANVTVAEKGTNQVVLTNEEGNFSITVTKSNAILVFSSVGYETVEQSTANGSVVNISLKQSVSGLDEIVVTALGIKREKKALTYASQTVGGDEIRKASNINFMDALSGKAAGIDIKISASGAGGSTKAVLRGNKSITGLSEALYVIDGIPMVNNKGGQPGSYGGVDQGDGLSAVNPEDIESVNILRGANASILYGSLGANGVILITTKKGKAGRAIVNLSSSTVFDQASNLPDFQYEYGAEGASVYNWATTKGNYQNGYIKDFFQTGITAANSVSIAGGNDKTTAYFSYTNTYAKGIMPTNTYNRNNISFNQSTKLFNDKVTISSNVMLLSEVSHNRPGAGYYNNPLTGLYLFSRQLDFDYYKNNYQVYDSSRNLYKMNWYSTEEKQNNPYWEIYKDPKLAKTNRLIASVKASYDIANHLRFEAKANIDYANKLFDNRYAAGGNSVSVSSTGSWNYLKYTDQSLYTDGILSYNNTFGDLSLTALAGLVYQETIFRDGMSFSNGTIPLQYPNFFTFANLPYNLVTPQTYGGRVVKQGALGNIQLGYKDMLFLDLSGRNDWASTLALTGNQSYFYPAVGITAIISDMVKMPEVISFLKLRASLTQTANEVPFNVVNPLNVIGGAGGPPFPQGIGGINYNSQTPFTDLKPEKITSNEFGTEMKFFNGRLGLDFTYYSDVSTNQFLTVPALAGSGYTIRYINAGKITNKGFELTVNAQPVRYANFQWNTSVNLSQNKNKIIDLVTDNPDYIYYNNNDDEGFTSLIKAGGSFNDVWIYGFNRNEAGQIILDGNGVPTKAGTRMKVGNANPDFLLGWNNNFNYRSFFLNILVNGKFGGVAFSKTEAFLDSYGVSQRSADARASGTIPIDAVQGTNKVTSIDPVLYYSTIGDRNKIMEPYIFSRTNVRLAQFVLGYNIPVRPNTFLKDASVSLIGRNLFFFYKKAPYDPEQVMSTNNASQSNEVFNVPATRSYGITLKATL